MVAEEAEEEEEEEAVAVAVMVVEGEGEAVRHSPTAKGPHPSMHSIALRSVSVCMCTDMCVRLLLHALCVCPSNSKAFSSSALPHH